MPPKQQTQPEQGEESSADRKKQLLDEIAALKKERNALILSHTYQIKDIQDMADFVGDSFELSRKAASASQDTIVFCGVDFMAETAKILSPFKTVLLPEKTATCPMANMVDAPSIEKYRTDNPGTAIVAYVNTTAAVKAVSDVCVTSSSALRIVNSLKESRILFIPDTNLGRYVASKVPSKQVDLWPGFCPVHQNRIALEDVLALKRKHPGAAVLVHPECTEEVAATADAMLSTSQMIQFARDSPLKEFIIVTEAGIKHALEKNCPGKRFYTLKNARCRNMKKITLAKVRDSLRDLKHRIELPVEMIERAAIPLRRMLES